MKYLEMEPDDNSVLSDESLRLVLLLCGQSVKDKLLYKGDYYYRLNRGTSHVSIGRTDLEFSRGYYLSDNEDQGQRT